MRTLSLPQTNGTLCLNKIFTDSSSYYCSVSKILFKALYLVNWYTFHISKFKELHPSNCSK